MKLSSAKTELKLALAPSVAESVLSVPVLKQSRAGRPKMQRLVTTYYETPEKDLARRGLTLRVRQDDNKRRCHVVEAPTRSGLLCETLNGRSDLAPRGHRRGAKHRGAFGLI
jgi:triphosphatase